MCFPDSLVLSSETNPAFPTLLFLFSHPTPDVQACINQQDSNYNDTFPFTIHPVFSWCENEMWPKITQFGGGHGRSLSLRTFELFFQSVLFFFLILSFFLSTKTKQKPTDRKNKKLDVCRRLLFKPMASEDRNYLLDGTNEQDPGT